MYPEVRAAVAADAGGGLGAPGFDLAAHREEARLANLRLPREDVASVEDVDADGVRCRLYVPADAAARSRRARARRRLRAQRHRRPRRHLPAHGQPGSPRGAERGLPPTARAPVPRRARRPRHGRRLAAPRGPARAVRRPRRLGRRQPRPGRRPAQPRLLQRGRAGLPLPRPAHRLPVVAAGGGVGLRPGRGDLVLGAVRPHRRPTTTTPTSRRCSPTGSTPCRPPSSPPRRPTRCATRGRSSPGGSLRRASRSSASAAWARPTASGGTRRSPPPSRWCARWPAGSTSTSRRLSGGALA